jgi:hypothetical protein
MSKAPLFVMVGSGVIIMISLIMIGSGMIDIQEIDVENEAVFQGTSGTFQAETYGGYTIFVNDQFTCEETTVSITDGTDELFVLECDSVLDEAGWRSIGVIDVETTGQLSVTSNHEIIIVDDVVYLEEGAGLMFGGGGLCCIGIIGLVIGIIMAFNQKGKGGLQHVIIQHPMMQQQYQQPVQQQYQQPPHGP